MSFQKEIPIRDSIFSDVDHELQFQTLFADERARSVSHKQNYQRLKTDYNRLQDEYKSLRDEMQQFSEDLHKTQAASQLSLESAQKALREKQQEVLALHAQLASSTQSEQASHHSFMPRLNLEQQEELESELHQLRQEVGRLRYQQSMTLAQAEFDLLRERRENREIQARQVIELNTLQELNEALISDSSSPKDEEGHNLERDNIQLRSRSSSLLKELESLRSEAIKAATEAEEVTRSHLRQIAQHTSDLRDTESENTSLKLQKEVLAKELSICRESNSVLLAQQRTLKNAISEFKSQISNLERSHSTEMMDLRADLDREQVQLNAHKEALLSELNSVQLELELCQAAKAKQAIVFEEQERNSEQRLEANRLDYLDQQKRYDENRKRLEKQLLECESKGEQEVSLHRNYVYSMEEKLKARQKDKVQAELQIQTLKSLFGRLEEDLEKERKHAFQLQKESEGDKGKAKDVERQMKEQMEHLKKELEKTNLQFKQLESEKTNEVEVLASRLTEEVSFFEKEKEKLNERVQNLESQITSTEKLHNQKIKEKDNKLKTLTHQNAQYRRKMKELKSRKTKTQQSNVSEEEHMRVLKLLQDLQRRLHLFRGIMSSTSLLKLVPASVNLTTLSQQPTKVKETSSKKQMGREASLNTTKVEEII